MKKAGADRIPHLGSRRALVLHKPHANVNALMRQLAAIGLDASAVWPDLPDDTLDADFVFFDVDMACDQQFPWKPGQAPMPLIAVIGTEAPGRIEWAMSHRADAHLVKPVGSAGIYSALLIALQKFEERRGLLGQIAALKAQVGERRTVVRAILALTRQGLSEDEAFRHLRAFAMRERITIEAAAHEIVRVPARSSLG